MEDSYTCPSAGYIIGRIQSQASGATVKVNVNGTAVYTAQGNTVYVKREVAANNVITITSTNWTYTSFGISFIAKY